MPTNPELFREMSQPFASTKEANDALTAFFDDLGELRKKHKITNVYCVVSGSAKTEGGEEGEFIASMMYGNQLMAETLAAWALGRESTERQERIAEVLANAGGIKKHKNRS